MSIPDEPSIDWANLPVDEALQLLGPEWVTIDDAVAILGQSKSKVDRRRGDEPGPDGPLESLRVRGRRVLVRIPSEELEDPSRMHLAYERRIQALEAELADERRRTDELRLQDERLRSRLRDYDRDLDLTSVARRDEAGRHDAEMRRLRESYEGAVAQAAQERRLSATLEEDLASTEEEGDRFRAGFEATERELGVFKELVDTNGINIRDLHRRVGDRQTRINTLEDRVQQLTGEAERLQGIGASDRRRLQVAQSVRVGARRFGGWMGLLGMGVGMAFLLMCLFLYVMIRAPIAVFITSFT